MWRLTKPTVVLSLKRNKCHQTIFKSTFYFLIDRKVFMSLIIEKILTPLSPPPGKSRNNFIFLFFLVFSSISLSGDNFLSIPRIRIFLSRDKKPSPILIFGTKNSSFCGSCLLRNIPTDDNLVPNIFFFELELRTGQWRWFNGLPTIVTTGGGGFISSSSFSFD